MINKVESYQPICDICSKKGELYHSLEELAIKSKPKGWIIKGKSVLCPKCAATMNKNY